MRTKPLIIRKPWGKEIIFADSSRYMGKILVIYKGRRLSMQYHKKKQETLLCVKGICRVELKGRTIMLNKNHCLELKPGVKHRLCAPFTKVELYEVSTAHPKDVVRLDDDYGRIDI